MGTNARQDAHPDRRRLHGVACWGDMRRALLRLDLEPSARVCRAAVGAAGLPVRVALGRVRSGHPCLGRILPALDVVRRPGHPGNTPRGSGC